MLPARELACNYHERGEEELTFREQKTYQDPPRHSKPSHLRSQTPDTELLRIIELAI